MNNGIMKRLAATWLQLATKSHLSEYVSVRDIRRFKRRYLAEGLPFLTVVLPRLSKAMLAGFNSGRISPSDFDGWRVPKGQAYPAFLAGAFRVLFDREGNLRSTVHEFSDNPAGLQREAGAVACIRQLGELCYKLKLEPTVSQMCDALDAFIGVEDEMHSGFTSYHLDEVPVDTCALGNIHALPGIYLDDDGLSGQELTRELSKVVDDQVVIMRRARRIVHRLLGKVDPTKLTPKHGTGASACRVPPHERYESFRYISRVNEVFPYDQYFYYNDTHLCDEVGKLLEAEVCDPSARLAFVEKDSRGPRIISAEPREFMYLQKGLERRLLKAVLKHKQIAGMISWLDQTRNRKMALAGSLDPKRYATIDLSEASDRLAWKLVQYLFPRGWVRALGACRSLGTKLPAIPGTRYSKSRILEFEKFAPMGSAVCFPVETICFFAITAAACRLDEKQLFGPTQTNGDLPQVSVYGDDIITPSEFATRTARALTLAGLKVNMTKSYWSDDVPFRESCGGDYYKGVDVTPVRWKTPPTDDAAGHHAAVRVVNNITARYGDGIDVLGLIPLVAEWYGPTPISNRYRIKDHRVEPLFGGALALIGPYTNVPFTYRRRTQRDTRSETDYCRREFYVPYESGVDMDVDADGWCHILRRELERFPDRPVDQIAIPQRKSHSWRWIAL